MNQIVINVRGGVIQDVFCDAGDVTVIDWDTEGSSPADQCICEVPIANQDEGGPRTARAFVSEPLTHPLAELAGTNVEAALTVAGVRVEDKSNGLLSACEAAHTEIVGLLNRADTQGIDLESLWLVADQLTREIAKAKGCAA